MRSRRSFLSLMGSAAGLAFVAACGAGDTAKDSGSSAPAAVSGAAPATSAGAPAAAATTAPTGYAKPELLLDTEAVVAKLTDAKTVIVDLRKKESYDAGHIPGAVWYDSAKLKDPDEKLYVIREKLFSQLAGDIGIDGAKHVIAYDDQAGLSATRFWWVLWYYGHSNASVINGGWQKWEKDGRATSKEPAKIDKATFTPKINDQVICALDYVKEKGSAAGSNTVVLDVRSPAEYSGADVRAAKGGHVPNAVNLDWTRSMTETEPKVWKTAAELRKQFEGAGIKPGSEVITYCQTGVRAAHSLFTLQLMGYGGAKVYDGSWQEWGNNKDTPVGR